MRNGDLESGALTATVTATQVSQPRIRRVLTELRDARERTLELISELDEQQLTSVYSKLLSPLAWDLGHIAAFEDLWVSRTFQIPRLRPELTAVYDADETPRALRGDLDILSPSDALGFLREARARTLELVENDPECNVDRLHLIARHELQHNETMLQALQIAGLPIPDVWRQRATAPVRAADSSLAQFVTIDGGRVRVGHDSALGFAYDNEKPEHELSLGSFRIASSPATNGDWQRFIDAGGYEEPELWSEAGWQWRTAEQAQRPLNWTVNGTQVVLGLELPSDPCGAVTHISFWEAQAFSVWSKARLPTEYEWEAAMRAADHKHGEQSLNTGQVWEWTCSEFTGYPGFVADPYREYSEQFFDNGYRVLRGGAWATSAHVASYSFRNWDHPQRRQIFSGVRLAKDL